MNTMIHCARWLDIDAEAEVERISEFLRTTLSRRLRRRGLVVGLSGGIDSTVTAAIAVKALGADRVFGLMMPERESSPDTRRLSHEVARHLNIDSTEEDITPILESMGFYRRYRTAVQRILPHYGEGWHSKIVASESSSSRGFTFFSLVAEDPSGESTTVRLPLAIYLEIVAATNFKQRVRKNLEYFHADRLNYAVAGTPNRLEYDQGFFVKNGDGSADVKPIAHLYKTQVYALAKHLGVPEEIRLRPPTTDTYSMPQGQDEFYFALPYPQMDLCLFGRNEGRAPEEVGAAAQLTTEQVLAIWSSIDRKRETTRYLHLPPLLARDVQEIKAH